MNSFWKNETFVGFDVETSGQYPLTAEVCEIAAVKWRAGQIIDQFQSLVTTQKPMSEKVIAIHNITNEMLVGAPSLGSVIKNFHAFVGDSTLIAHHAPFDLGFLAPEIENSRLPFPVKPVLCSSLLARKAFPESENHKLQTLIRYFQLEQGTAHRALDDAKACLSVGLKVFEKLGSEKTVGEILKYQGADLEWTKYSVAQLRSHPAFAVVIEALKTNQPVQITYAGGSRPGQARTVMPLGLVRNPLDDYLVAQETLDELPKRYFLNKIKSACL